VTDCIDPCARCNGTPDLVPQVLPLTGGRDYVAFDFDGPQSFRVISSSAGNPLPAAILFAPARRPTSDDQAMRSTGFGAGVLPCGGTWWFKINSSTATELKLQFLARYSDSAVPHDRVGDSIGGNYRYLPMKFTTGNGNGATDTGRILLPANADRQGLVIHYPLNILASGVSATSNGSYGLAIGFGAAPSATWQQANGATLPSATGGSLWLTAGSTYSAFNSSVWRGSVEIWAGSSISSALSPALHFLVMEQV
jgi:hypothetical protein